VTAPADILIVEDSPTDLELILRALERASMASSVNVVRDGAEALEYLGRTGRYRSLAGARNPMMVLLDLKLPLVSGREVLERVKGDPATRDIPIVVMTSSREEPDLRFCYALGVNSYIVKPLDIAQFFRTVAEVGIYWTLQNESPPQSG
jgi:two-component system, response regulator